MMGGIRNLVPVAACSSYTFFSMVMTLTNKTLLTNFAFKAPILLLLWQHFATVVITVIQRYIPKFWWKSNNNLESVSSVVNNNRIINPNPFFDLRIATRWLPVNAIFVGMLLTGQYSLKFLGVPMITIFKNFTTIGITLGDSYFFGRSLSSFVVGCLVLMFVSSVVAGANDLAFHFEGYLWMSANAALNVAYSLYTQKVRQTLKLTSSELVLYNNLLAIPFLSVLLFFELDVTAIALSLVSSEKGMPDGFWIVVLLNGMSGWLISASNFWALEATSPTTVSIIGSLNKIPLTIVGFWLFSNPVTPLGFWSIVIGLLAGVLYAYAKAREAQQQQRQQLMKQYKI